MENIFWTGYSNQERHAAINKIQIVVSKYGDLVDFKLYSDISLTMTIEIEESKIDTLYAALKDNIGMDSFECLQSVSLRERIIYLTINFVKGTGDLKVEVPFFPG